MLHSHSAQDVNQKNNSWKNWNPKRGEIFLVNLGNEINNLGSEQRGLRPFAVLSNNIGNSVGTILVGCSISSRSKGLSRIHVPVGAEEGLRFQSYLMVESIRSVSKCRFFINNNYPIKVGELSDEKLKQVEEAIMFELGFNLGRVN